MSQITATLTTGTAVQLSNGIHKWGADEPVDLGGTDSAPNPYELLLSSLAACTCITLSFYCNRKGIALKAVHATYDHARIHADDCADCDDSKSGYIDTITSNVVVEGDFDEAQRKRLADIVTRCPVHKTLVKGIEFFDNATFI